MARNRFFNRLAVVLFACAIHPVAALEVALDPSVTYQTIEGIGRCRIRMYSVFNGPFPEPVPFERLADTLINMSGQSWSRGFRTDAPDFNPSPGEYVITENIRLELERCRRFKELADSAGQIYRYAPNVFSPPGWMKWNGSASSHLLGIYWDDTTNSLMPEHYDDFGALCSAYIRIAVDSFDLPVYAFSPQNEPYFNTRYPSCTYKSGLHYAEMLRFVGPSIKRASPTTLIYGVEHMGHTFPSWETAIMSDPLARDYLDRFAIHHYQDQNTADTSTFDGEFETRVRPVYLSEYGGGPRAWNTLDSGLTLARIYLSALTKGFFSVVNAAESCIWWNPNGGGKYWSFWVHAHHARFIRPNMVQIALDAPGADSDFMIGAFANRDVGSLSIVALNRSASDVTIELTSTGQLPAYFEGRVSDSTRRFVDLGEVSSASPITIPARSLFSLGYRHRAGDGPVTVVERRRARPAVAQAATTVSGTPLMLDLRGRTVALSSSRSTPAPGAYCRVLRDNAGRTILRRVVVQSQRP